MALNGIGNPLTTALPGRPLQNGGAAGTQGTRPQAQPLRAPAARPQSPLRPQQPLAGTPQGALPSEAPTGTDPALWSVLTGEERAYFAKAAASGPLTYSRISAGVNALAGHPLPAPPAASLGARLDVRA
jgi:hypothetical protein